MRRPGAVGERPAHPPSGSGGGHPLADPAENARLFDYETTVKDAFDRIVPALKRISSVQFEKNFERRAQDTAREALGFELPEPILSDAWIARLDMRRLFAWCVFEIYRRFCDDFYRNDPLVHYGAAGFEQELQGCGFHTFDITPCADGRLAHVLRYVLRLPHRSVRRKSYAGALFDIEDSIEKWIEVEMLRFREGRPNTADAPTRYLKAVAYHFSSVDPLREGCAAHGSDTGKAAAAGLERLRAFQQAIENSFCCGASIDLLLIGVDTDTDAIRLHVPDVNGQIGPDRWVDALSLYEITANGSPEAAKRQIASAIEQACGNVSPGMMQLARRLLSNNLSQIEYVRRYHGLTYADTGHAERFIGAGIGFEEIQLRNLMYFSYMSTVEEAAQDLDVGIRIFKTLNLERGLPVPIVVRFDYHGQVPGARDRSIANGCRVAAAMRTRYSELAGNGLLHTLQVVRDCNADGPIEVVDNSADRATAQGGH